MQVPECDFSMCMRFFGRNKVSSLNRQIYLLMLGLDNSGKTCTAKSLVGDSIEDVTPTIGFAKVITKYKGFQVTLFDLGGSKTFRGIWPKYFHEVHGLIFVVDSSDSRRLDETALVFAEILGHEKIQGKPVLMLCNKSDLEDAIDEVHLVNTLQVEKLVNQAKCPTRVEASIANKNQGLREGFKWLVKSVIANIDVLGARVDQDVQEEQALQAQRQIEIKRRIEERKKNEVVEEDQEENGTPPGFVPISEIRANLAKSEAENSNQKPADSESKVVHEESVEVAESGGGLRLEAEDQKSVGPTLEEIEIDTSTYLENGIVIKKKPGWQNELPPVFGSGKLELEPIVRTKKTNILKKMQSRTSVVAVDFNSNSSMA